MIRSTPGPAQADDTLLEALAARMDEHDRGTPGRFPEEAWSALEWSGATVGDGLSVVAGQDLVRTVGRVDVSLGRLLDGHLNGVQRLREQVPADAAPDDLDALRAGRLRLGVWGADPGPGEGEPARLRADGPDRWVLDGVKTFCSGAGGLHRAFVLVRGPQDTAPLRLAYVDLEHDAEVDATWFGGAGMRGSASHRVVFHGARALWVADEPGALMRRPWILQDGMRTAASWAGGADRVVDDTVAALRAKGADGDLDGLAVAQLLQARRALDLWLAHGAAAVETDGPDAADEALLARHAIATAIREILDGSSRALGSRPFSTGGRIERARRDLETYLLQHRLEPMLARLGRTTLAADA